MYMIERQQWTEYHSHQWALLVETGWITWTVEELSDGTRMALMIKQESRTRWVY
jgi:hypothetical protein